MTTTPMFLHQVLVPTVHRRSGKPVRTRFHRVWDAKVRAITGGLTICQPVKGQWVSPEGELFTERMIPVMLMCTRPQMRDIVKMTMQHYDQLAVMHWKVSDAVEITHRIEPA